MYFSQKAVALVASLSTAQAALLGFNYGATKSDGYTLMQQADFQTLFTKAQNLAGTSGWNAARLYTSIQSGTAPTEAFAAAMATNTKLLLGLWGSAGDQTIINEIAAINAAVKQFGSKFTSLVIGISVGSEDLYRISETGIINKSGVGASPTDIANYIQQTKQAFAGTALSGVPVGHVDTWTAWVNSSNAAVINAADFIGVDAYPYFQNTQANAIGNSRDLFDSAISAVKSFAGGKEIWVTETGFPVAGPSSGQAIPSNENAQAYWQAVGCNDLFNVTNTFWYTLEDNYGGSLNTQAGPSFGIIDSNGNELFPLTCNSAAATASSSSPIPASETAVPTNIGGGSPGISDIPSGVASAASTTGTVSGASAAATSGAASSSPTSAFTTSLTTTNSAGQTITTAVAVNSTGSSTGTTMKPSSSTAPSQGSAVHRAAPVAGLLGALLAVFAAL